MKRNTALHAFCDDALGDADATALAARIRTREISAAEAVKASIARAQRLEATLNAIEFPCFERAEKDAANPSVGMFAGVPSFLKDNIQREGLPTGYGTQAFAAGPARQTDPFAKQYLAQGFICLGKSRMPEFGFSASTEFMNQPDTCNPWGTAYSTGASSGGAAALVAAGVVPIAHANDGGGSIRIPAACCGLVGLKPSRGRLPAPEASRKLPVDLAVEGVLTRTVRDTANFYADAARHFPGHLPAIGHVQTPAKRRLRVGVVYDSITGRSDAETRAAVKQTALLLEQMGHQVSEIDLPISESFVQDFGIYWGMLAFMLSHLGRWLVHPSFDADRLDNLSRGLASHYRRHIWKTPKVLSRLRTIPRAYGGMFVNQDVILSPVLAHRTPELGYLSPTLDFDTLFDRLTRYVSFTPLNNISGGPGISLPLATTHDGMPMGMHFSAPLGDERTLLELAFELEQARPWQRIHVN